VTLHHSEDYKSESSDSSFCLNAKDSQVETFKVTAKELNEVNITVEAAINAAAVPECGTPGDAEGYKDTLQKLIHVKPEGFPVEKVQSEFLCRAADMAEKEEMIEMESLRLPSNLVRPTFCGFTMFLHFTLLFMLPHTINSIHIFCTNFYLVFYGYTGL
jgi:hypothetical protein